MNSHKVLGDKSILKNLNDDLLRMIIKHARFEPRADTGNALRKLIGFGFFAKTILFAAFRPCGKCLQPALLW